MKRQYPAGSLRPMLIIRFSALALAAAVTFSAHAQNTLPATQDPRNLGEAAGLYAGTIELLNTIKDSGCGPALRREVPHTRQAIQSDILPRFPADVRSEAAQALTDLQGEMRSTAERTLSGLYRHYTTNDGYSHDAACAAIATSAITMRKLTFEAMERLSGEGSYGAQAPQPKPAGGSLSNPFADANYAECLLSKLPGAANDIATNAIVQTCKASHPGGIAAVEQGVGRGMFGHKNGAECTAKKAGNTLSKRAAQIIGVACRRLYDEPNFFDQFDHDQKTPAQ